MKLSDTFSLLFISLYALGESFRMVQRENGCNDPRSDGEPELNHREFDARELFDGLKTMIRKAMTVVTKFGGLMALVWDRPDGDVHGFEKVSEWNWCDVMLFLVKVQKEVRDYIQFVDSMIFVQD